MAAPLSPANSRKTHCPQGHAYDAENTAIWNSETGSGKKRVCKECRRAISQASRKRLRGEESAAPPPSP